MLLQLGSEESLCVSPASLAAVLSLKFPYWVKNKRQQTFMFSVVMLIKEHVLCPASVSWHPPAPASQCPVELEAAGSHPTLPGSCGWSPQHLVLSCARNMKAWGEKGHFLRNVQIRFPNCFSCWFLCMVTAVQTKCLPVGQKSLSDFLVILFCVF